MIMRIYSIWDAKAEAFMQPFFMPNKGMAIRSVTEALRNENSTFRNYPDDFHLYEIGNYDDSTGRLEAAVPIAIMCLRELMEE